MASGNEAQDNPVNVNVVPMVDVIFCLCVFFMCSFKFKQLEGRFESWLPKHLGGRAIEPEEPREMRVALAWDEATGQTARQYGTRSVRDDSELEGLLRGSHDDFTLSGAPSPPLIVDSDARVPWADVLAVVNIGKRLGIGEIQFALGAGAPANH